MQSAIRAQATKSSKVDSIFNSNDRWQLYSPPLGVAAALIAAAWSFIDPLYGPSQPYLAGGTATIGISLLAPSLIRHRTRLQFVCWMLLIGMISTVCLTTLDRILGPMEARIGPLGFYAQIVAPLLELTGYPAGIHGEHLSVTHPDGLVQILPSFEKLGLYSLTSLYCLWTVLRVVLDGRRLFDIAVTGVLLFPAVALVRFFICSLLFLEYDNVLTGQNGFTALSIYNSHIVDSVTLVASGFILDFIASRMVTSIEIPHQSLSFKRLGLFSAVFLGLGLLMGFTIWLTPPGKQKSGRVLFDDRFCGVWEPTARQLDTEWYGDFSTYSFSSLAEWLGHWFVVDVNTRYEYTDSFLAQYDVLVIKTPVLPIPASEREAIDRFVTSGGGLLLVGDHTNLLGMGTHLNSLCEKYGISFRYDSVSDATSGGFVNFFAPSIGKSPSAIHVKHLQFMTSCSLEVSINAEPIIVASGCRRDPHDYANPSFFGRSGPHPELSHGSTVLAASARAGKGTIAAFTDSTVWSSFAVFQFDREKLAADLVNLLNRDHSLAGPVLRVIAVITLVLTVSFCYCSVQLTEARLGLIGLFIGGWGGVLISDRVHADLYDLGPSRSPVHEVAFLWQGGSCAFPPVLGDTGSLPMDRAFDTLFVSVQRLGFVPRVAYTYDKDLFTSDTRVLFVIAPVMNPPRSTLSRIQSFVQEGGMLIILDDGRLGGSGSAGDYLKTFGVHLKYTVSSTASNQPHVHSSLEGLSELKDTPASDVFVGYQAFGDGHVVYMREASEFSRAKMGHCFSRPGKSASERYKTIFWLLTNILKPVENDRRYYGICE